MTGSVTLTMSVLHAQVLRNTLKKRAAEIENHIKREGEAMDAFDHGLVQEFKRQLDECIAIIEAELPQKARA